MSTSTASTAAQRPVTAYLPQGRFGHAVVEHLAEPQDVVLSVDHGLVYASVPYADRLVMISDADRTPVREALDEVSFVRSLPSLGLELTPTELRCGPLVVPGRTACYHCYARRRQQHRCRRATPGITWSSVPGWSGSPWGFWTMATPPTGARAMTSSAGRCGPSTSSPG